MATRKPYRHRHPIYIISKGRADTCHTHHLLARDGVEHKVVIEPQEHAAYAKHVDPKVLTVLPFSNLGLGGIPARNWVWEDSIANGAERHWILDDNMTHTFRRFRGYRVECNARFVFQAIDDFVDLFDNVAVAGPNYEFLTHDWSRFDPYRLNVHVYSFLNIRNDLPIRWRGRYNEDTDLCLQALSLGWCTVQFLQWLVHKNLTMSMKGGNSDELYSGHGRVYMSRSLERVWPRVVETARRFGRAQHRIRYNWQRFDTPLRPKPGVVLPDKPKDYGMQLVRTRAKIEGGRNVRMMRAGKPRVSEGAE